MNRLFNLVVVLVGVVVIVTADTAPATSAVSHHRNQPIMVTPQTTPRPHPKVFSSHKPQPEISVETLQSLHQQHSTSLADPASCTFYISHTGNDSYTGLSPQQAVASFTQAWNNALLYNPGGQPTTGTVTICFMPDPAGAAYSLSPGHQVSMTYTFGCTAPYTRGLVIRSVMNDPSTVTVWQTYLFTPGSNSVVSFLSCVPITVSGLAFAGGGILLLETPQATPQTPLLQSFVFDRTWWGTGPGSPSLELLIYPSAKTNTQRSVISVSNSRFYGIVNPNEPVLRIWSGGGPISITNTTFQEMITPNSGVMKIYTVSNYPSDVIYIADSHFVNNTAAQSTKTSGIVDISSGACQVTVYRSSWIGNTISTIGTGSMGAGWPTPGNSEPLNIVTSQSNNNQNYQPGTISIRNSVFRGNSYTGTISITYAGSVLQNTYISGNTFTNNRVWNGSMTNTPGWRSPPLAPGVLLSIEYWFQSLIDVSIRANTWDCNTEVQVDPTTGAILSPAATGLPTYGLMTPPVTIAVQSPLSDQFLETVVVFNTITTASCPASVIPPPSTTSVCSALSTPNLPSLQQNANAQFWSAADGLFACAACAAGSLPPASGSDASYELDVSKACTPCGQGTYSNGTGPMTSACIGCPSGSYSSSSGASSCTSCSVSSGAYTAGANATTCSYCLSGQELVTNTDSSTGDLMSSCQDCGKGYYSSDWFWNTGNTYCISCDSFWYTTAGTRSTSVWDCDELTPGGTAMIVVIVIGSICSCLGFFYRIVYRMRVQREAALRRVAVLNSRQQHQYAQLSAAHQQQQQQQVMYQPPAMASAPGAIINNPNNNAPPPAYGQITTVVVAGVEGSTNDNYQRL